jgi:hypothetical protein
MKIQIALQMEIDREHIPYFTVILKQRVEMKMFYFPTLMLNLVAYDFARTS